MKNWFTSHSQSNFGLKTSMIMDISHCPRPPHLLLRVTLCSAVIFVLIFFYTEYWFDTPKTTLVDLRFKTSECGSQAEKKPKQLHSICKCPRSSKPLLVAPYQKPSACSDHASSRGPGQNVVAYSFYGKVGSRYFVGTEMNIQKVAELYPGWVMRLYNNISMTDPKEVHELCRLWCTYPHFDVCHVHHLPAPLCNKSEIFGMVWRFFVLGDSLVDRFMIRDLDSEIYQREVNAVKEWIKSGRAWHSMRDHPYHYLPMLGGMWGGKNVDLNITSNMRKELIRKGRLWQRGYDQTLLTEIVWPYAHKDMLQHDSYKCLEFNHTDPWPTKRIGNQFVGSNFPWEKFKYKKNECPVKCRPRQHLDWLYC